MMMNFEPSHYRLMRSTIKSDVDVLIYPITPFLHLDIQIDIRTARYSWLAFVSLPLFHRQNLVRLV